MSPFKLFLILWILQVVFWRGSAKIQNSLTFRMLFWTVLRALRVLLWWKFPSLWTRALSIFRSSWRYTAAVVLVMKDPLKRRVNLKVGGENWLKSRNIQILTMIDHRAYGKLGSLEIRFHRRSPLLPPPCDKHYWGPVSSAVYLLPTLPPMTPLCWTNIILLFPFLNAVFAFVRERG